MADDETRALERALAEAPDSDLVREALGRARLRAGLCSSCGRVPAQVGACLGCLSARAIQSLGPVAAAQLGYTAQPLVGPCAVCGDERECDLVGASVGAKDARGRDDLVAVLVCTACKKGLKLSETVKGGGKLPSIEVELGTLARSIYPVGAQAVSRGVRAVLPVVDGANLHPTRSPSGEVKLSEVAEKVAKVRRNRKARG